LFRTYKPNRQSANEQTYNSKNQTSKSSKKQKKIIDSNEGEYIDYEEIKD
jgi:hypothetical protein